MIVLETAAPRGPRRSRTVRHDPVGAWASAEQEYRRSTWAGEPAVIVARRFGPRGVLLTAPHAGHQLRNGWRKPADSGTGGLAETMARLCGCAFVAVRGVQSGDPNWDEETGVFKQEAARRLVRHPFALDIHGLDSGRHVDICIGLGPNPDAATFAFAQQMAALARRRGFVTSVNVPFPAAGKGTVTRFVQSSGYRGMQIEINWRFLDPEGRPEAAAHIVDWLREVIIAAPIA